ncbi:hypothetical protein GGD81_003214 [Rhodobium orientis]|uniref:DUF2927 domain-containing protein n=2 Tax=Rhodobium orientis TaxID=34017 RepID=A0A327JRG5_9HYPH|nr:DUF2927 domain-containing protein [Rhodobium orientis]MBB4304158.1 hypothetical protein [Rhodobium orientis]MBK5950629.1 hypothetical protein [Rhodobium orientis]RAI28014.1 hypothetical protein CH339_07875 [Rhodobium orientis]
MLKPVLAALAFWLAAASTALAATPHVEAIVTAYSDEQLIDGFMRTVFGAEDPSQRRGPGANHIRKFPGRVRVHVIDLARRDHRTGDIRRFVAKLDRTVKGLKMSMSADQNRAEMIVFLVDRADYRGVIEETMPRQFNKRFLISSDCSAVTGGRRGDNLDRAFVFIVVNEGRRAFRHCMIEEISQSLGPVNDDWRLKESIFNDYSTVSRFNVFDWFILNMLYDRRVKVGMTPRQVERVLPAAIADARIRLRRIVATGQLSQRR